MLFHSPLVGSPEPLSLSLTVSPTPPGVGKPSSVSLVMDPLEVETNTLEFEVVEGVAKVTIPEEILADAKPLWSAFVVGHFIGYAPHVGKIHATVNRI